MMQTMSQMRSDSKANSRERIILFTYSPCFLPFWADYDGLRRLHKRYENGDSLSLHFLSLHFSRPSWTCKAKDSLEVLSPNSGDTLVSSVLAKSNERNGDYGRYIRSHRRPLFNNPKKYGTTRNLIF